MFDVNGYKQADEDANGTLGLCGHHSWIFSSEQGLPCSEENYRRVLLHPRVSCLSGVAFPRI